jgi:hypothetical protein
MRHNTSADNYEEIVMGPFEKALAGCQPAKLAELAKANKVKELEKLIGRIDEQEEDGEGQRLWGRIRRCNALLLTTCDVVCGCACMRVCACVCGCVCICAHTLESVCEHIAANREVA